MKRRRDRRRKRMVFLLHRPGWVVGRVAVAWLRYHWNGYVDIVEHN